MLIHSLALTSAVWDGVAELLNEGDTSVLTYDCRGHGASDTDIGPLTLADFATDLAGLLDAVGWSDAHVAGCSMGGSIALQFALAHPRRTRTLALIDTTAWYGSDAVRSWDERAARALADGLASLVDFQLARWFSDAYRAAHPEIARRFAGLFVANDVDAYAQTCRMLGRFDLREELRTLRVPTAVLVGEEDFATPLPMARDLHERIAGSTLEVLSPGRHLTPIECHKRVAALLGALHTRAEER
ncbi:MAG: alpha/beta hydrolase [Vulcanimicrobiaceae bacterium]